MDTDLCVFDGLVTKAREYDGQRLLHCCLSSPVRAIDIKEGSWKGSLIGAATTISSEISVYGEGTTTYDDGSGQRIVIIAGEQINEDDEVSAILRVSRNEVILSIPLSPIVPESPFWITNRETTNTIQRQSIKLRPAIQFLAQTCDYKAHLRFQQWFYEMHDKMMPLRDESYSNIWKGELAVAEATKLQNGCWLPAAFDGCHCVLQIDSVRDNVIVATAHYLGVNGSLLSVGDELVRSVYWNDESEYVTIGEVDEVVTFVK